MLLDDMWLRQLVYGGAVLGAGGGGSIRAGLRAGRKALAAGPLRLADLKELPEDARLLTFTGVGTTGKVLGVEKLDWQRTKALQAFMETGQQQIGGFVSSEVGPLAVTYGWRESAATGIPVVDAPCNGRAHPMGLMGSLGLHRLPKHITTTVAVGGEPGADNYVELTTRTNVTNASYLVRNAASKLRVPMGVVRNPVLASYVRKHAAVGALKYARSVGEALLENLKDGLPAVLASLAKVMGGRVLAQGRVQSADLAERQGFTLGTIVLSTDADAQVRIPLCNEYMMVMQDGVPLAAFPDLIALFDRNSSLPLSTADVRPGQHLVAFGVPRSRLILGSAMRDRSLLRPIEVLLRVRFPASSLDPTLDKPTQLAALIRR